VTDIPDPAPPPLQKQLNMKRGCSARTQPRELQDRGSEPQATGLGRQGRREGSPVQVGKVLVRWVRRLEGPEAASAGLVLAQNVRTLAPRRSKQFKGFQSQVKHFRLPPRGGGRGATTPPHLQSAPTSTLPRPRLWPHTLTLTLTPTPTPYTQRAVKALDPHPGPWNVSGLVASGAGPRHAALPGEWVLGTATDWRPRRHLSSRCTRPLVLTDM